MKYLRRDGGNEDEEEDEKQAAGDETHEVICESRTDL